MYTMRTVIIILKPTAPIHAITWKIFNNRAFGSGQTRMNEMIQRKAQDWTHLTERNKLPHY